MDSPFCYAYESTGDPLKPMLLFLHGFLGNRFDWKDIVADLVSNFFCVTVDLPGHGQSTIGSRSITMSDCAYAIRHLLGELQVSQCTLVGYSMGGRIALYTAIHHTDIVSHLVLESSCPGLKTQTEQQQRQAEDARRAQQLKATDFQTFLTHWYQQPLFQTLSQQGDLFEPMLKERLKNNPSELAKSLTMLGTGTQASLWDQLQKVSNRVFLIVGEKDLKFVQWAKEMSGLFPQSQMCIIDGATHNVHQEQRDAYLKSLKDFLNSAMGNHSHAS